MIGDDVASIYNIVDSSHQYRPLSHIMSACGHCVWSPIDLYYLLSRSVFDTKRLMGRMFDDEEIKEFIDKAPFNVMKDPQFRTDVSSKYPKDIVIEVTSNNKKELYRPEDIGALILKEIKSKCLV